MKQEILSFFDIDFIQDIIGALIGTGTALLIFYLTIKSDKKSEKENLEKLNRQRQIYFKNLLESNFKQFKLFLHLVEKHLEVLKNSKLEFPICEINPDSSSNRFKLLLQNDEYFYSFVDLYGEDLIFNYNEIALEVEYFDAVETQFIQKTDEISNHVRELRKEYAWKIHYLIENKIAGLTKKPEVLPKKEDIDKINRLYSNLIKNQKTSQELHILYREFVDTVMKEILFQNTDKTEILDIIFEIKTFKNQEIEIRNQLNSRIKELEYLIENSRKRLENYKKNTKELL